MANDNKVKSTTDEKGNTSTYEYNNYLLTTTITDSTKKKTVQVYDNLYNIIKNTDPEGKTATYSFKNSDGTPNNFGETDSETNRNGAKTSYLRDGNGNITTQTNQNNSFKTFEYDSNNNKTRETDESKKNVFYVYDSTGSYLVYKLQAINDTNIYKTGDPIDKSKFDVTTYTYYSNSEAITKGYNVKGLLNTVTDPNGNNIAYTYDADGNIKTVFDGKDTTTYNYSSIGWKDSEISPKGYTTGYIYDKNGNLQRTTLKGGEITRTAYDKESRKLKEI